MPIVLVPQELLIRVMLAVLLVMFMLAAAVVLALLAQTEMCQMVLVVQVVLHPLLVLL
jgi:hypothetical protein